MGLRKSTVAVVLAVAVAVLGLASPARAFKAKKGVVLPVSKQMLVAMAQTELVAREYGRELVVTSGREGGHRSNSLHYKGLAFDMRTRFWSRSKINAVRVSLRKQLGKQFDIIKEKDHIHVELEHPVWEPVFRLYSSSYKMACTGFAAKPFDPGYDNVFVVTASHCPPRANVAFPMALETWKKMKITERPLGALVYWISRIDTVLLEGGPEVDLAIGIMAGASPTYVERPVLKLAKATPPAGTTIYVSGFPDGVERHARGRIVEIHDKRVRLHGMIPLAVEGITSVLPGSSGSPVMNDRGEVVGMIVQYFSWVDDDDNPVVTNTSGALMIPVERLNKSFQFLKSWLRE